MIIVFSGWCARSHLRVSLINLISLINNLIKLNKLNFWIEMY